MGENDVLSRIRELVEEEHALRRRTQAGQLDVAEEQARLARVEESLDQCWDLLRQRRALQVAGQNADDAGVRPTDEVERYLQ